MFVYLITNTINGKRYVGQTKFSLKRRWKNHRYHSNCRALKHAIDKYGYLNFTIEAICEVDSRDQANELEKKYIVEYGTLTPNGYNLTTGGLVFSHTEETLKRMSEIHKGRPCSEEKRKKLSEGNKGKHVCSPETLLKLSLSHIGIPVSEEAKRKISEKLLGRPRPKDVIERIRKGNLGRKHTEESLQRMRDSWVLRKIKAASQEGLGE